MGKIEGSDNQYVDVGNSETTISNIGSSSRDK